MITYLSHLGSSLLSARESERDVIDSSIIKICDGGILLGLRWPYSLNHQGMYSNAKKRKGSWTGDYWRFPTTYIAEAMLAHLEKKFPELPVVDAAGKKYSESENAFFTMPISPEIYACFLSHKLSYFTSIPGLLIRSELSRLTSRVVPWPFAQNASDSSQPSTQKLNVNVFKVLDGTTEIVAILAPPEVVKTIAGAVKTAGARELPSLAERFQTSSLVKVATANWAVKVRIDLSNPCHWPLAIQRYMKVADGWACASTTRSKWGAWEKAIAAAGLEWEGDDPDAEDITIPVPFNQELAPGWSTPAPNGHLMHAYQKEGALFCARRGMRALIGDEMGVGKTIQAIAAAEATAAPRIVVVCPANARYVWDREIHGWGGRGDIQHLASQLDTFNPTARWHIITYDLLAARVETWKLNDEQELAAFSAACPDLVKKIEKAKPGHFPRKVTISKAIAIVPEFADRKRVAAWEKVMRRLRGELLAQILESGPILLILDEAHRVKNKDAKRAKAIQQIAVGDAQMLMLTGTPLRNNEHEAAALLSMLDVEAATTLSKERGYTLRDVQDYLSYFMIRRTKAEVLPELPEKTRQRIEISNLDSTALDAYRDALLWSRECYDKAIAAGKSDAEARQSMQGGIERARTALGVAKVLGGDVVDLVVDVAENKGCCVVFCAHHEASDNLKSQLQKFGLRAAVVDGRTSQKERATLVKDFQEGRLDVFIGGINAAGEAITLTRADTVIFVELDWVPAALLQAEDRIHRVGQRSNCQVIQLVARLPDEENLDGMMIGLIGSKIARIGMVLGEDTDNIISGSIKTQIRDQILRKDHVALAKAPLPDCAKSPASNVPMQEEVQAVIAPVVVPQKRRRGRPKVYVDQAPPSPTERSKQSIKALAAAGGKRVMLRLSPDAYEALKSIMAVTGSQQETAAINQALVARKNELLSAAWGSTEGTNRIPKCAKCGSVATDKSARRNKPNLS